MTGVLRARVGDAWVDIGGVGPMGPQGPQGPQGPPGADVGNHVIKTGDTMTGRLWVDVGNAPAVSLTGTGVHMEFWTDGRAQREGYVQGHGGGVTVQADIGNVHLGTAPGYYLALNASGSHVMVGHLNLSGYNLNGINICESNGFNLYGNNSFYFATWGGGWYMTDGTYIRATNDKHVWLGGGWFGSNGGISIGYGGTPNYGYCADFNGSVRVGHTTTIDACRITSNGGWNGSWGNTAYLAQKSSGGDRTGYAIHPGGVAKSMMMLPNNGYITFYNEDAGWYADLYASTITQVSQRRGKTNIKAWPAKSAGSAVMDACNRLSLIDVISYQIKPEHALIQAESMIDGGEPELHECGPDTCGHTDDDPCHRVKEWLVPQIGVIIEDLATVLPEAVGLDPDGNPGGMRLGSMIGYLLAVCKEQQERIESLEHHLEAA